MKGMHGIIFSYEKRNDLRELGEIRSASSIPFGGRYRAVDFSLSNLVNAGVTDVGVVLHGHYQSLLDHLGTGKDWDLSRKRGGLKILPPFAYKQKWGETAFRGKMEAPAGVRSYLDTIRQDYVVLLEGDLVVNLPLAEIFETHLQSGADITVVCGNDSFATENGTYFELDHGGWVTDVLYHLHNPRGYRGLEAYIISTQLLKDLVDECYVHDQFSWRRTCFRPARTSSGSTPMSGTALPPRSVLSRVLRPQHAAAQPRHPGGAVLPGAAHPGQGRRQVLGLHRPQRRLHQLPGGRRQLHRGQGGKLHPVPRRARRGRAR